MKRAVILFPRFKNIDIINGIREKYDPLVGCIGPHITIVFPFDSDLSTEELKAHFATVLKGVRAFSVKLSGITGDYPDGYLFLNVKKGNDNIIELHDKLYSSILEGHLFRKVTYCPHLTVGRVCDSDAFDKALNDLISCNEIFEACIDKIYVENIDSLDKSTIEFTFDLDRGEL